MCCGWWERKERERWVRACGSGMVSDSGNLWWDSNERINKMTDLETIINTQCHSKIFYFYYFVGVVKQMSFQASTSTVLTNPNYNQSHECHMTITWRSCDCVYISYNTNALHVITTSIACKYLLQDEMMRDSEDDCWISDTNTTLKS